MSCVSGKWVDPATHKCLSRLPDSMHPCENLVITIGHGDPGRGGLTGGAVVREVDE